MKKLLGISGIIMSLMLGLPVLAETNTNVVVSKKSETSATKIECVGRAIATRESSLASAFNTHSEKVSAAYATRANELSGAYTNNTVKATQAGVKVAWAGFNKTVKAAKADWKTNKNTIWSDFKKSAALCKAETGVSDSANSSSEF